MKRYLPYIAAFVTVLFWASAFPAVKFVLNYYSPEAIMLLRFIIASLFLAIYCSYKKIKLPSKKDFSIFFLGGFIGIFAYMWLFNYGTSMVTSGISSFIIASSPVFTLILSIIFLKEKFTIMTVLGMLISLSGLFLIAYSRVSGASMDKGTLLLIGAALCNGVYNIIQRKIIRKYSSIQSTFFCILIATVFMFIFLPNLIKDFSKAPMIANLIIIYLGIFPAAISYMLWGYSLSKVQSTVYTTSFLYLSPFMSIIIAYFWLGEVISNLVLMGGIVIIIGLVITNLKLKKKQNS